MKLTIVALLLSTSLAYAENIVPQAQTPGGPKQLTLKITNYSGICDSFVVYDGNDLSKSCDKEVHFVRHPNGRYGIAFVLRKGNITSTTMFTGVSGNFKNNRNDRIWPLDSMTIAETSDGTWAVGKEPIAAVGLCVEMHNDKDAFVGFDCHAENVFGSVRTLFSAND
jgi:hypothetical protein